MPKTILTAALAALIAAFALASECAMRAVGTKVVADGDGADDV